jgi:hypothetical protein
MVEPLGQEMNRFYGKESRLSFQGVIIALAHKADANYNHNA